MPTTQGPGYNAAVEGFRETEYPMIKDSVYLDHAGTTLCAKSVMDAFASEMTSALFGNPHSASPSSQLSTSRIEDARMNLLSFFGADPAQYDLVFVPNATAGVKLVVDAMRSQPQGWFYAYHQACHTSLVGAREEALDSLCLDDDTVKSWIDGTDPFGDSPHQQPPITLFSYSAQSHMDGKRYPLSWSRDLKRANIDSDSRIFTLLDASSFSATSRLALDDPNLSPDFIVFSLYKIFGFPDLGALIVRRSAEFIFDRRKYFGGGTVDMVVSGKEQWHAPKSHFLHERLEDGTLPFHSIVALDIAMGVHLKLFGSMDHVSSHTSYLTQRLLHGLNRLRHANGAPVCSIYTESSGDPESLGTGPAVAFNIRNSLGAWISLTEFEKLASLKMMHIRTGGLCNPGGIASALGLQPWEMKRNFSAGYKCGAENDIISGKPTGVIRASLGAMSTVSDVDRFVSFVKEFFRETALPTPMAEDFDGLEATIPVGQPRLRLKAITVYPIKSCGGFSVPPGVPWEIRPEGLAWDRECASVDALNKEIRSRGGDAVEDRTFRANIVLEQADGMKGQQAFAEDGWASLCIGRQNFKLLGACRRCQMLCVDQETAEKKEEPFVTLAKTRRFDGKVYFGVHMRHDPPSRNDYTSKETQYPTIEVGEVVNVESRD
ncbi:hypothetical protein G7Z17_g12587 [Cylindrodendrum hubeiense]|uniref:Molybdenum cofactor sulfurase n=1 Tax=Cylindrodendrum hubeiense TaxID=595255 RepID=A0A9P5GV86_9HYPO|nr:hypothetical protein G7Z17_g12587 [Cylindrodendrum hubeiense]